MVLARPLDPFSQSVPSRGSADRCTRQSVRARCGKTAFRYDAGMTRSPFRSPLQSPAALGRFFVIAAGGFALDLYTKAVAAARLDGTEPSRVIPGWLQLEFTRNHGAVFGIAQGQRWAFLIVSAGALAFLTWLFAGSGRRWFYQIVLGLLLAGVLGNMYDRVTLGYVRDMIHALPGRHWPGFVTHALPFLPSELFPWIFNVADSLLCVGVALMMLHSLLQPAAEPHETPADAAV